MFIDFQKYIKVYWKATWKEVGEVRNEADTIRKG